jgi:serine/threonine-protein kinase HipA
MTDYRSVQELEVYQNEDRVATLTRISKGCEFRYTESFLASNQKPIALHLPESPEGIRTEGIANLPTYFAGLLPEGIMFNAVKTMIGTATDDLFAILAATGSDAIGDITVRIPGQTEQKPNLNLAEATSIIEGLVKQGQPLSASRITAISGVQPKMSLGEIMRASRNHMFIAKFESPEFPDLIRNEHATMRLAKRCNIDVADIRLEPNALIVRRFDRQYNPDARRMEKLHVEDLLQVMDLFPSSKYTMEYGDLMTAMANLQMSKAALLDVLHLFVFSYIVGNGDLHAKNVSLVYDRTDGLWRMSPAYDLISTLPYREVLPGADRMALALCNESFTRFSVQDFVDFGGKFGLSERAVEGMINRTTRGVLNHAEKLMGRVVTPEILGVLVDRAESLSI